MLAAIAPLRVPPSELGGGEAGRNSRAEQDWVVPPLKPVTTGSGTLSGRGEHGCYGCGRYLEPVGQIRFERCFPGLMDNTLRHNSRRKRRRDDAGAKTARRVQVPTHATDWSENRQFVRSARSQPRPDSFDTDLFQLRYGANRLATEFGDRLFGYRNVKARSFGCTANQDLAMSLLYEITSSASP